MKTESAPEKNSKTENRNEGRTWSLCYFLILGAVISLAPSSKENTIFVIAVTILSFLFKDFYSRFIPVEKKAVGNESLGKPENRKILVFGKWIENLPSIRKKSPGMNGPRIPLGILTFFLQIIVAMVYLFLSLKLKILTLQIQTVIHLAAAAVLILASHRSILMLPIFFNIIAVFIGLNSNIPFWGKICLVPYSLLFFKILIDDHRETLAQLDHNQWINFQRPHRSWFKKNSRSIYVLMPLWVLLGASIWLAQETKIGSKNSFDTSLITKVVEFNKWAGKKFRRMLNLKDESSNDVPLDQIENAAKDPLQSANPLEEAGEKLSELRKELSKLPNGQDQGETEKKKMDDLLESTERNLKKAQDENLGDKAAKRSFGASDSMDLSKPGDLNSWDQMAFQIKIPKSDMAQMMVGSQTLFRGEALEIFDESGWKTSANSVPVEAQSIENPDTESIEITRAESQSSILPTLYDSRILRVENSEGSVVSMAETPRKSFRTIGEANGPLRYWISLPEDSNGKNHRAPWPEHLALSKDPDFNQWLKNKAAEIFQSSRSPAVVISALKKYFSDNGFKYSLKTLAEGTDLSISKRIPQFLETDKNGHCELYATTTALLLRANGTFAQVVNGYRLVERNPDNSVMIRNKHAHAWVEVWDDSQKKWLPFDTTVGNSDAEPPKAISEAAELARKNLTPEVVNQAAKIAEAEAQVKELRGLLKNSKANRETLIPAVDKAIAKLRELKEQQFKIPASSEEDENTKTKKLAKNAEQDLKMLESHLQNLSKKTDEKAEVANEINAARKQVEKLQQNAEQKLKIKDEKNQAAKKLEEVKENLKNLSAKLISQANNPAIKKTENGKVAAELGRISSKASDQLKNPPSEATQPEQIADLNQQKNDLTATIASIEKMQDEVIKKSRDKNLKSKIEPMINQVKGALEEGVAALTEKQNTLSKAAELENSVKNTSTEINQSLKKLAAIKNKKIDDARKQLKNSEENSGLLKKNLLNLFYKFLRFSMVAFFTWLPLNWLWKIFSPGSNSDPSALKPEISKELYKELYERLREIDRSVYPPEKEVIQRFNVSLELLEGLKFQRPEGLPVDEYIARFSIKMKTRLWQPFRDMSQVFNKVFYGAESASTTELQQVRKESEELFSIAKRFVKNSKSL